jgi:hypothetical protein
VQGNCFLGDECRKTLVSGWDLVSKTRSKQARAVSWLLAISQPEL